MSEHYSGNDPETGCGMLLIVGIVAIVFWALVLAFLAGRAFG